MSSFNQTYGISYRGIPKTLKFTDSSTQGSYQASYDRMDMPHILVATCDLLVEGTAETTLDTSRSTYWPAGKELFFRPDKRHPNIFYQRANSSPFDTDNYVTIALIVPDSVRDTVFINLLKYTDGTFTRASTGTRLTSATTLTSSAVNVIRLENRGDFTLPLFEGQRTNIHTQSQDISTWTQHDSTTTANYAAAPDGTTTASRVQILYADDFGPYKQFVVPSSQLACSSWAKSTGAAGDRIRFSFGQTNGPPNGLSFTCTTDWQYGTAAGVVTPDTDNYLFNGQLNKPTSGNPALPICDVLSWGHQLELARFSSSYIPTSGTTVIRSPDSNLFTTSQYDSDICTLGGDFYFAPEFVDTEPTVGNDFWLVNFQGSGDGLVFAHAAGGMRVECRVGGSVVLASNYLTWARFGRIDVSFRPSQGTLAISNAVSGNGTTSAAAFTFPNTDVRQAGYYGGTDELYGRMSNVTITV